MMLHQHVVTIFIDVTLGGDANYIGTLPSNYIDTALQSSSGEGVVYIDADRCPHDVIIFFDLLPGQDTDYTGMPPFFYTELRSSL